METVGAVTVGVSPFIDGPQLTLMVRFEVVDFLWNRTVDSSKTSLSLMNQQFCSRENQLLQMLQQNEKSTQIYNGEMLCYRSSKFSLLGVLLHI